MAAEINLIRLYENIQRPPLPTRINLDPSIDKQSLHREVWDEITYPLQSFNGWTVEICCYYSPMLGLSLNHVSKGGPVVYVQHHHL